MLDAKKEKTTKRLFFLKQEGLSAINKTVVVSKGREFKDSFTVHLPASGIHDKLTSIDIQVLGMESKGEDNVQESNNRLAQVNCVTPLSLTKKFCNGGRKMIHDQKVSVTRYYICLLSRLSSFTDKFAKVLYFNSEFCDFFAMATSK